MPSSSQHCKHNPWRSAQNRPAPGIRAFLTWDFSWTDYSQHHCSPFTYSCDPFSLLLDSGSCHELVDHPYFPLGLSPFSPWPLIGSSLPPVWVLVPSGCITDTSALSVFSFSSGWVQGSGDELGLGLLSLESDGGRGVRQWLQHTGADRVCSGSRKRKGLAAGGDTCEDQGRTGQGCSWHTWNCESFGVAGFMRHRQAGKPGSGQAY